MHDAPSPPHAHTHTTPPIHDAPSPPPPHTTLIEYTPPVHDPHTTLIYVCAMTQNCS